ncbi:hypothetical protein ACI8AC_09860 [Geodermatophilus sp. SYSU D00758]
MAERTDGQTRTREEPSAEDLLVPVVPGVISSLLLEGLGELTGVQKLAVGTGLGVLAWLVLRLRHRPRRQQEGSVWQRWRWALVTLAGVSLLALAVTVAVFGRPTPTTAIVALLALGVLYGFALAGRRASGAGAAALSGALIGLCLGIALL